MDVRSVVVCICILCMRCVLISGCTSDGPASPVVATTAAAAEPTVGETPAGEQVGAIHYIELLMYPPPESSCVGEEPGGATATVRGRDWSWVIQSDTPPAR